MRAPDADMFVQTSFTPAPGWLMGADQGGTMQPLQLDPGGAVKVRVVNPYAIEAIVPLAILVCVILHAADRICELLSDVLRELQRQHEGQ